MTAVKVVDTSALAALLFGEPEAETVAERLQGARLVAPALLQFELANVCLVKCRQHPEQRDALLAGFALRDRLGIDEQNIDPEEVVRLALDTNLTAYDASYLWLALHLGAELVTLDKKLLRAVTAR